MIDKSLRPTNQLPKLEPIRFDKGGAVEMYDMTVGPNESIGNDMVMLTFPDGTKRQTQKALYEAAESLGAFDNMTSGDDFAAWHLNEWAGKVVSDPQYKAAHDQFNTDQISYNTALIEANPEIAENRLAFVQQNAPNNQAAIDAAQSLIDPFQDTSPFTVKDDDGREVTITSGADSFMDFTAFNNSLLNSAPSTNNDVLSSAVDTAFPMDKDASGMPDTRGPNVPGNRPPATNEGIGSIFGTNVPIDPRIPIDFKDENFEIPILTPFKFPELPRTYGPDPRQNRGTDTPVPFYRPPVMSPKNEFTDKMFVDTLQTAPQQRNNYTNPFRRPT